jgi:hypothetical protein
MRIGSRRKGERTIKTTTNKRTTKKQEAEVGH